jgi:hypothetical protein
MKAQLATLKRQAVNVGLTILLIVAWMGLSAYLDAQPSETDALQASALDHADAIADARAAAKERRAP